MDRAASTDEAPVRGRRLIGQSWMWGLLAAYVVLASVYQWARGNWDSGSDLVVSGVLFAFAFGLGCWAWRAERQALARHAALPAEGDPEHP